MPIDTGKLGSHRLRGFGPEENGRSALVRACQSAVPFLEIDTRVGSDGRIFVHHDPRPKGRLVPRPRFAVAAPPVLAGTRYQSGDALLDLEEALRIFADRRHRSQRLCLDLKDFGFERQHLELVGRCGVERETAWMSWVPRSLVALRDAGAAGPLILAHCSLVRFGPLGTLFESALSQAEIRLGDVVVRGVRRAFELPRFGHGFQHGLVCARLPRAVEGFLARSDGGVCVNSIFVSDTLMRYCREAGLRLWVYQVRTVSAYVRYAAFAPIEWIFADVAPSVLAAADQVEVATATATRPVRSDHPSMSGQLVEGAG